MDLLYVHMQEHSQKLQLYSAMYSEIQQTFDVEKAFTTTMNQIQKLQAKDVNDFIQMK